MWSRLKMAWLVLMKRNISLWVRRIDPDTSLVIEQWIMDLQWPYALAEITLAMDRVRSKQERGDIDKLREELGLKLERERKWDEKYSPVPEGVVKRFREVTEMSDCAHAKQMDYIDPDATDEEREDHVQQSWKDRQPKKP